MSKLSFYCLIYLLPQICFGFLNGKLGSLDLSSSISGSYDSNLFGVSKDEFQILKNTKDLESDDDFIIKFSPVVHYSKKVSLLNFGVNAGFELAEYIFNNNRSYLIPTTDIILDFDDTLSKSKTFSNNAKIRFSANFDIGQNIGTDLIEGDLISYTYFTAGFDIRYNHSPKFGVSTGTSYSIREYQSGSLNSYYDDFSTLPISNNLFYIYSPKLDFFLNYTFQRSKTASTTNDLGNYTSHSFAGGANGQLSQKLSGQVSLGVTTLSFKNQTSNGKTSLNSTVSLNLSHNQKTTSKVFLTRQFSPSARGYLQLGTTIGYGITHKLNEKMNGTLGTSYTHSEISQLGKRPSEITQLSLNGGINHQISRIFSGNLNYEFSNVSRVQSKFNKHVITATLQGRF
jgi:hypothetical protein